MEEEEGGLAWFGGREGVCPGPNGKKGDGERGGIRKEGEKEKSRKGKSGRRDTMEEEEREGGG